MEGGMWKTKMTIADPHHTHIAPRGAKKEQAFGGVILKSERPSGALFTNSGPPFFTVESKIEVLSPLGTSFHWLRTSLFHCSVQNRGPESARDLFSLTQDLTFLNYWHRNRGPEFTHAFFSTLNGTKEANTSLMPFLDSRLKIPQWKEIIHYASAHLFSSATLFSAFKTLSFSVMFLMASSSAILRCLFHWFRPLFLGQSPLILFFFSCRVGCQYRFSQRIKVVKPAEESLSHSSNINHLVQIILLPALVPREISATRSISAQTPHRWLRTVVLLWLVDWGGLSWQHQVQFPGTRWLGMKWSRTS